MSRMFDFTWIMKTSPWHLKEKKIFYGIANKHLRYWMSPWWKQNKTCLLSFKNANISLHSNVCQSLQHTFGVKKPAHRYSNYGVCCKPKPCFILRERQVGNNFQNFPFGNKEIMLWKKKSSMKNNHF